MIDKNKVQVSHKNIIQATPTFSTLLLREGEELSNIVHKLSHDIGNPLTSIISFGAIIHRAFESGQTIESSKMLFYMDSMVEEAWRIAQANERYVMLLSGRTPHPSPCDLRSALKKALEKLKKKYPEASQVMLNSEEPSPIVLIEESQLQIVFRELLGNAFFALQSIDSEVTGRKRVPTISFIQGEDFGEVTLTNVLQRPNSLPLEKLFEPFVTTHADSRHLGLGLTVSWAIIERFAGEFMLEQEEIEGGFLFRSRIRLPKTLPVESKKEMSGSQRALSRIYSTVQDKLSSLLPKRFSVLIIEDEPTVSSAIQRILELVLSPYTSVNCQCASDRGAIELFERGEIFNCVLCDLNLQGTSGQYIYEIVQNRFSSQAEAFAFLSGDQKGRETQEYLKNSNRPYLHKPFEPEQLLELIVEVLQQKGK